MITMLGLRLTSFALICAHCFSYVQLRASFSRARGRQQLRLAESNDVSSTAGWATHALLFSSWTDGVAANKDAQLLLKYSLLTKMLRDKLNNHEEEVKSSVEFSPCNGPDISALNNLEIADVLLDQGNSILESNSIINDSFSTWSKGVLKWLLRTNKSVELKFLYIPTAMYALSPSSSNTPGKQRQRARADGKKRRDQVMKLLNEMFTENDDETTKLNICAITLDLDDGSLKQPAGFLNQDSVPKDATYALSGWNPHLIYVEGGNTFWLQYCIEKGNYPQAIIDSCTGKNGAVYCGKSAGAIVAGNYIETAIWKGWDNPSIVPERESYDQWIGCKGFGFAGNRSFFPHYSSEWESLVKEKTKLEPMSGTVEVLYEDAVYGVFGDSGKRFVLGSKLIA